MRINRIPRDLRRANMGELLQKHLDAVGQNKPNGLKRKRLVELLDHCCTHADCHLAREYLPPTRKTTNPPLPLLPIQRSALSPVLFPLVFRHRPISLALKGHNL